MHSIEDLNKIIQVAKQFEEKGEYLHAYTNYLYVEWAVDNDDDSYPYTGMNIAQFEEVQYYAHCQRRKIWWRLTEEEKAIAFYHRWRQNDYL